MKAIIIEDEKPAARRLGRMLQGLDLEVVAMLHSVEESIAWFDENPAPDLIFLDIQLSDGLSFEIFEAIEVDSAIIFTTAYDEYALQAFKLNSVDYLLKPIDSDELSSALNKFKGMGRSKQGEALLQISDIKKLLVGPVENFRQRYTVRVGQHLKIIKTSEVECFYSENKGTYAATKEGRSYLMETTLEDLETELDPQKFFRASRKFIVNIEAIKDIVAYTNSRLKLRIEAVSDQEIIVSRERVKEFKEWLQ